MELKQCVSSVNTCEVFDFKYVERLSWAVWVRRSQILILSA